MADQQSLQGQPAALSVTWLDADGEPASPSGTVTVGVTRADGTAVLAAGTATTGSGTSRSVTVPAEDTDELDVITATWTNGTTERVTTCEIVGGFYFSVADLRAVETSLSDTTKYPSAAVRRARAEVEGEFERICERAFVPRFARQTVLVTDASVLRLPVADLRRVRSVTVDDEAWTAAELADLTTEGRLLHGSGFRAPTVVAWEYGLDHPPSEVVRAAMARTRYRLNLAVAGVPDRATSFTVTEGGTYRLDTPGPTRVGVPEIDAVLGRWTARALIG
jgi:hypothetical protein